MGQRAAAAIATNLVFFGQQTLIGLSGWPQYCADIDIAQMGREESRTQWGPGIHWSIIYVVTTLFLFRLGGNQFVTASIRAPKAKGSSS